MATPRRYPRVEPINLIRLLDLLGAYVSATVFVVVSTNFSEVGTTRNERQEFGDMKKGSNALHLVPCLETEI